MERLKGLSDDLKNKPPEDSLKKNKKEKEIIKANMKAGAGKRLVEMGIMSDSTSDEEDPYYERITKVIEEVKTTPQGEITPDGEPGEIPDDDKKLSNKISSLGSKLVSKVFAPTKGSTDKPNKNEEFKTEQEALPTGRHLLA